LVESVALLAFGCLGLTTAEVIKGKQAIKGLKEEKVEETDGNN
jgi:hypothetical protein